MYFPDRQFRNKILGSQAAFGTTFRVTGSYQKDGTSSLKRVTGSIFQLVSDFIEIGRNFLLDFFTKRQPKIVKTISAHSKSTTFILKHWTILISWHYPFKFWTFRRNLQEKALFGFSTAIIALPLLNSIFIPNFRNPDVSECLFLSLFQLYLYNFSLFNALIWENMLGVPKVHISFWS